MEVILNKDKLNSSLSFLEKVVKKKDVSDVYKNCQFEFKKGTLTFYACGGQYVAKSIYGDVASDDFSCLIEYDSLKKLISLLDSEEVICKFAKKSLSISDGGNKYRFQYYDEGDFSFIVDNIDIPATPAVTIDVEALDKINKFLSPCVDTSKNATLCGIFFDGNFVATDSKNCGVYSYNRISGDSGDNALNIFIPKDGFDILSTLSDKEIVFDIYNSGNVLIAESPDVLYMIPQLASNFPNYEPLFEKVAKHSFSIELEKDKFVKSCSKLLPFASSIANILPTVNFTVGDTVIMKAGTERKSAVEELSPVNLVVKGEVEFTVNVLQLLNQISKIEEDTVTIQFTDSGDPLYMYGDMDRSYLTTLLVKRKEDI